MWCWLKLVYKRKSLCFSQVCSRSGTNNRDEFHALQLILKGASTEGIQRIQVMGDSKLHMDWANCSHVENLVLSTVMNRVSVTRMKLLDISLIFMDNLMRKWIDYLKKHYHSRKGLYHVDFPWNSATAVVNKSETNHCNKTQNFSPILQHNSKKTQVFFLGKPNWENPLQAVDFIERIWAIDLLQGNTVLLENTYVFPA